MSRRELLDGSLADVWKKFRDNLAAISHDKCWYCETPITRDDLYVDHYRPKGHVFGTGEDNEGYWWLAFDEKNFRLSCKYCNELRNDKVGGTRGGKGSYFPLLEGSVRATATDRSEDREFPIILDPIKKPDVDLLMFLADSKAWPRHAEKVNAVAFMRADRTITILHLNHGRLRKARGQICNQVAEAVERADLAYRTYLQRRQAAADAASAAEARRPYDDAVQRLADFLRDSAAYAGAARSVIKQARAKAGREWLDELLL